MLPTLVDPKLAEVEGDDDLDLLDTDGSAWFVFRNDGSGNFALAYTAEHFAQNLVAADVDADGDPDVLGLVASGRLELWLNDGSGTFANATGTHLRAPDILSDLRVLDLDDDGDPDVYASARNVVSSDVWFQNDGLGRFGPPPPGRGAVEGTTNVILGSGDLDGDGDEDLLLSHRGGLLAVHNLLRQIDVPFAPRIGGTLTIEAHMNDGRSGAARFAVPLVSVALGNPIRVGQLRTFHLFDGGMLVLPPIAVPGAFGSATYAIPNTPVTAALDLYMQAVLLPGPDLATWRLSNVAQRSVLR